MKTARARVMMFVITCPHCGDYLVEPNSGSTQFSINESTAATAFCADCGLESRIPARCYGDMIIRRPNEAALQKIRDLFAEPTRGEA